MRNLFNRLINGGIVLAAVSVLISACAMGPDYVRPATSVPESYKENKNWKIAEPKDDILRGPWWEIYNDPRLNALEEQVNISNQNIAAAEAQFRQASALIQAATSGFFPAITVNPAVTRSLRSSNITQSTVPPGTTTIYSAPLNALSWELDVWGRIRRTVEAARASARASAADLEGIRLSVQASLAQNYFLICALDRQKQLLDATLTAYGRSLDLTKKQYASGVASRADVLQAETQLKATHAQAIDVGVQRAQVEHAIALLVGKPAPDFTIPVMSLDSIPPPVPAGVPSELLERRPDIAGAERRVVAANAQIGVARAAYFPTITLTGSMGYQSADTFNLLTWPSRFWSVGPAMAETLFNGGLREALNDQARAAYDAAVASYRQTVLIGFQEVEDNLAALRILEEEAKIQNEAVNAAQKYLQIAMNQYKEGMVNYINVVVAQAMALNNERTAVNILSRRMTASVLLIKALGGGWEQSNRKETPQSR
jgi:NodT family efflux transporter outer membrane factor (OMF) lipoprotein